MPKQKKPMGAHWEGTSYSPLYQLSRRTEKVASDLNRRRKNGWVATKQYIDELYAIADKLKALDKSRKGR